MHEDTKLKFIDEYAIISQAEMEVFLYGST